MTDNYVSPYGFGGVTDAVLDCVAERHGITAGELADRIHRNAAIPEATNDPALGKGDGIYDWIDLYSWDTVLGPAIDEFDKRIFPEHQWQPTK